MHEILTPRSFLNYVNRQTLKKFFRTIFFLFVLVLCPKSQIRVYMTKLILDMKGTRGVHSEDRFVHTLNAGMW